MLTLLLLLVLAGLVFLAFAILPQVPMRFWQVLGICVMAGVVLWWFATGLARQRAISAASGASADTSAIMPGYSSAIWPAKA